MAIQVKGQITDGLLPIMLVQCLGPAMTLLGRVGNHQRRGLHCEAARN